jgi:hypothetical protein
MDSDREDRPDNQKGTEPEKKKTAQNWVPDLPPYKRVPNGHNGDGTVMC